MTASPSSSKASNHGSAATSKKAPAVKGPIYKPDSGNVVLVRRAKRKNEGLMKRMAKWLVDNQINFSFNLLAVLFLVHGSGRVREHTDKYFNLSYYNPHTGKYGIGVDDGYPILFCIILFTLLRAATMDYVLAPFARSQGISKKKAVTRFSEQAWLMIYYGVFWPLGVYIYRHSPAYLNLRELWTGWPDRELDGIMKRYMLAQLAFWLQQLIVINIEERRKDHWQMFTHHIVTSTLIYASYRYGHTRVGNLILVLMDVVDIFLPAAKCLKYLGYNKLCDVMFGIFMVSWLIARHILYVMVCYSVWAHTPKIMPTGCFKGPAHALVGPLEPPANKGIFYLLDPLWDSDALVCYNKTVKWSFLSLLLILQALTIMWFSLIIRVAIKVLRGDGAEDSRSDDEGGEEEEGNEDEEEEEEFVYEEAQPLEEEVGVEEIDLKNWERRTGAKKRTGVVASTTAVSIPGHSDRKELLGRIGCEKQVTTD